jgi:predicted Zn finger-like uncharacterized protein
MTLATRCPVCGTAFRVQPAQLAARAGRVRCGKCNGVFDGIAGLVPETAGAAKPRQPEPLAQLPLFEPEAPPLAPPSAGAATGEIAAFGFPADRAGSRSSADRRATEEVPAAGFLAPEPSASARLRTVAWAVASAAALAALAAQALLHFRTEIAVLVPEARAPLAAVCRWLGCELALPRRPELMAIESSDLQADRDTEGVIVLNAVVRNRAPFAQEYPALELALTDERDQPVVRRVLRPEDYLGAAERARVVEGIAPGAEAVLRVRLDASGVRAVGYRLYLFFP